MGVEERWEHVGGRQRAEGFESSLRHPIASSQDISGFRRFSFCFDSLTEIHVDHPVLLGMQGDTNGPYCEAQNQGSLEQLLCDSPALLLILTMKNNVSSLPLDG